SAGGQASGATGNLSMREECPKGRGKFSLRRERRPQSAGRERQQGCLSVLVRGGGLIPVLRVHPRARMLEQSRDLGFRGLLPRLIPDRLIASGLRDGVTLPVGLRIVHAVVQLDYGDDFEGAALAYHEIRDLPVELGADGPLRFS